MAEQIIRSFYDITDVNTEINNIKNESVNNTAVSSPIFSDPLSYENIRNSMLAFKRAGGKMGWDQNILETPGYFFFKILFYFDNDKEGTGKNAGSGLLGLDWMYSDYENVTNNASQMANYFSNSAYHFLRLNRENERAELLKKFHILLSDINTYSPWYWSELDGLSTALERNMYNKAFAIDEERKKLTIKCLADPYDNRIGTLLDLYRSIVYSYKQKKEIVPANLRKFDMGIYIFNNMITNIHDKNPATISQPSHQNKQDPETYSGTYNTSSKYIEFHNCEIDINSSVTGYSTITNKEGFPMEYSIVISYDDAYEQRYNEFLDRNIGDFIITDYSGAETSSSQLDSSTHMSQLENRMYYYENLPPEKKDEEPVEKKNLKDMVNGLVNNAVDQAVTLGTKMGESLVTRLALGNFYGLSISNVKSSIDRFTSGNVVGGIQEAGNLLGVSVYDSVSKIGSFVGDTITDAMNTITNGTLDAIKIESNQQKIDSQISTLGKKFPGWVNTSSNNAENKKTENIKKFSQYAQNQVLINNL